MCEQCLHSPTQSICHSTRIYAIRNIINCAQGPINVCMDVCALPTAAYSRHGNVCAHAMQTLTRPHTDQGEGAAERNMHLFSSGVNVNQHCIIRFEYFSGFNLNR